MNNTLLDGKHAVITGGGKGIGKAIALRLARLGANITITGTTQTALEQTVNTITQQNGNANFTVADVSNEKDVLALFNQLPKVDVLINNAGIGRFADILDTTTEDWDRVIAVNLRGAFLCSREAMRKMRTTGGRIINISSVVGLKGYARQAAYTASKHGLIGLSKVMAAEGQKDNIITQVIAPGGVDTDMVGDARPDLDRSALITVEDIADTVEFMLRQNGNAVTDLIQLRRKGNAPW